MIASRNKKIPLYEEYISLAELERMYNNILIMKGVYSEVQKLEASKN